MLEKQKIKNLQIEAVITRANGSVENLGTVTYWDKNIFKRIWWHLKKIFNKQNKQDNNDILKFTK